MIVVDASVLIDALLDDGPTGVAARTVLSADTGWAAPPHPCIEALSVTRRRLLRTEIGGGRAAEAAAALAGLEVLWVDPSALVPRVRELRDDVAAASGPRCRIRTVG